MKDGIKLAIWVAVGFLLFWGVLQIIGAIFSFVAWVVNLVLTLAIVILLLAGAYYVGTRMLGSSTTAERERILE